MDKVSQAEPKQTTQLHQEHVPEPPEDITHVYTRQHNTTGLDAPYAGPFPVISRPTRSTVKIRVGYYKDGSERYELRHWRDLKLSPSFADVKDKEAHRPQLGRKPKNTPESSAPSRSEPATTDDAGKNKQTGRVLPATPAVEKQPPISNSRPIRSTRNQAPIYVDSIASIQTSGPPLVTPFPTSREAPRSSTMSSSPPESNHAPAAWSASSWELELINQSVGNQRGSSNKVSQSGPPIATHTPPAPG